MPFLVMIFAFILLNTNTSNAEKTSIEIQNPKLTIEQQEEIKRNLNSFDKQMEKELNYAKEKGKKWINDTNQDEEVYALITLNENITLDDYGQRNLPLTPSFLPLCANLFTRLRQALYQ